MKKRFTLFIVVLATISSTTAQIKVGSNSTTINTNSLLELESTSKGFLMPRVSLTSTSSFSPLTAHIAGMTVYNIATAGSGAIAVSPGYYYNDGSQWLKTLNKTDVLGANANNGLTSISGNIQLGGALITPTVITTTPANTLAIVGIQPSNSSTDKGLVVDSNGVLKTAVEITQDDATRFLGGTIYARFNSITGGTVASSKVISGNYAVGTNNTNITPRGGGINSVVGSGFTISNPLNGIFDIKFNTPYTQIYGISVNVVDAYITSDDPNPAIAGTRLLTTDNAQVAFLSNNILRIKTGNGSGAFSNRPFTFLVTGQ
jgi:hypothetical protein